MVSVCTVDEPLRDVGTNDCEHCGLCVPLICHCQILAPSTQGKISGPAASDPSESRSWGWGVVTNALSSKRKDLSSDNQNWAGMVCVQGTAGPGHAFPRFLPAPLFSLDVSWGAHMLLPRALLS